jgi:Lrp/AsnC family leucine-responsive transcriptional regulator
MIDQTDIQIIQLLKTNSRMQWQDIGDIVHLSGQAVKNRITKLSQLGILEGYTVKINAEKLGLSVTAFITVFMKTTDHIAFFKFVKQNNLVYEAHRISGEGCYLLTVYSHDQKELLDFLDELLTYGNYKVNLSMNKIK